MKRALSLIIVLAMVLCMIPFSAFAADWNVGGTDFIDGGNYALLEEENNWLIDELLWTATENGTVMGMNFTPYVEEVEEGEVGEDYSGVTVFARVEDVLVTEDGFEGYPVVAGESYEITLYTSDEDWKGTAVIDFVGLKGSQSNPYEIWNPKSPFAPTDNTDTTILLQPGESVYYALKNFNGEEVVITGAGVEVVLCGFEEVTYSGAVIDSETGAIVGWDESVTIPFGPNDSLVRITNNAKVAAAYVVSTVEIFGTMDNPAVAVLGENTASVVAGNYGYFYTYTATEDGTVSVLVDATFTAGEDVVHGWQFGVDKMHPVLDENGDPVMNMWGEPAMEYAYGDLIDSSMGEGIINPYTYDVVAGDVLKIMVNTFDSANPYVAPAGDVFVTISMVDDTEEPDPSEPTDPSDPEEPVGPVVLTDADLPYTSEELSGDFSAEYSYTATADGYLYVVGQNLVEESEDEAYLSLYSAVADAVVYQNGSLLPMSEGDVATIELYGYSFMNGSGVYSYEISWISEIAPDGSAAFPYAFEGTLLDGPVTIENNTDNDVYYSYEAEKVGIIETNFWNVDVYSVGQVVEFYIPAGSSNTFGYLPPVATIGEAEYYSIDEAVAAAVNDDEIVLVADAESVTGITLFAGVTLNLNGNVLTAPYIAALNGNFVVGAAGATINTTNMMAAELINIDGVDYEWVAGDGVYTLTEVVPEVPEQPPVVEEPKVAEYNGEVYGLTEALSLAAAAGTAQNPATVKLVADADMSGKTVTVPANVILDLYLYDLTAENIFVLSGGFAWSSSATGRYAGDIDTAATMNVARTNLVYTNNTAYKAAGSSMSSIPVWVNDRYAMIYITISEPSKDKYSLDTENNRVYYEFKHGGPGALTDLLKDNGSSDHGIKIICSVTWEAETTMDEITFVYKDSMVKSAANSSTTWYSFEFTGMDTVNIDYTTFKLQTRIVTDAGVCVFGPSK